MPRNSVKSNAPNERGKIDKVRQTGYRPGTLENWAGNTFGQLTARFNKLMGRIPLFDAFKLQVERIIRQQEIQYNEALEDKNRQLSLLYDIARALSGFLDSDDIYQEVLGIVGCMSDYHESVLMLCDEKAKRLKVVATYGVDDHEKLMRLYFKMGEGITGEAIRKKEAIYIPNTAKEPRYLHYGDLKPEDVAFLSVPLLEPSGDTVIGAINVSRPVDQPFSSQERETVQAVAHLISFSITNARLYAQVKELSVRDKLTGLYNRRHGDETIAREIKRASRFNRDLTLLMIDIDHFKNYNDRYGHPEGDRVLQMFASIIKSSIRDVDYVARWGGEEFVVLLPSTDLEGGYYVAEKIRRNIRKYPFPNRSTQPNRRFSVSVGLAVYPDCVSTQEDLISCADRALYEAKGSGRDRVITAQARQASKKVG